MVNIAGAGVRGLSCALYLVKRGINVTIYECRQEIGNPVRSPGIIKELDPSFIKKTLARKTDYGWALRREWFEKELAKKVFDLGCNIILKTKAPEDSINCTGGKSSSSGWPLSGTQYNLVKWNGGIVIRKDVPEEFTINRLESDRFCFERGDGLVECWIRGELPRPKQGWLELIQGEHPEDSNKLWIDEAILEGEDIAKSIIHHLKDE